MKFIGLIAAFAIGSVLTAVAATPSPTDWRDENIYQLLTDRFADGDPANNNADPEEAAAPANSRGIHGGDFKGIQQKLDYLKGLGVTAIWISPIPQNDTGSAYHGYGAKDFYTLAPHWGSLTDLSNMVSAAHARGIKVILDVVVNHAGNLVDSGDAGYPTFRDPGYNLRYRNIAKQHAPPFNITNTIPAAFPSIFHTNGVIQDFNNLAQVEQGELSNLDDFNTQSTYVRTNMANIYKYWIQTADLDGFRIDTVKHVEHGNGGFWNYWCPQIHNFAATLGKSNFFMFGEVYDGSDTKNGLYTGTMLSTNFALDSTLDYPLYFMVGSVFASATANTKQIEDHYNAIPGNYDLAAQSRLVTFLDNHDQRRFLNINSSTNRLNVALTFLYTARGVPCLYYGTEQAFNGGGDPDNREDMFDGVFEQTASLGDNFNPAHPLYRRIALLNNLRRVYPALRRGDHANRWNNSTGPGLFAYARQYQTQEVFVVLNTASSSQTLPARPTLYPAGTKLVNLFNTNETLTVNSTPNLPAFSVPGTSSKIFVALAQFQPLDPVVLTVTPAHGTINVSTGSTVVLRFSKPMNTNSVTAAFSFSGGTFTWSGLTQMTYRASGPLPTGTTNLVRIATTAFDNVDGKNIFAPFESYFVTAGTPSADTTPPTVVIGAPADATQVTGAFTITGTASDVGGTVAKVEVQLDNGAWTLATGTTTWSLTLNSTTFLNGTHPLAARATDSAGNLSPIDTRTLRFFNIPGAYLQRLAAGSPSNLTDCAANLWLTDQPYSLGAFGYSGGTTGYIPTSVISNTCASAQPLYQRERYSTPATSFRYLFDCPEGLYETTLLAAETYTNAPNARAFDVFIEGQQVLRNFDIFATAGGKSVPITLVFTNAVADSQLEIQFFPVLDNARASGIQIKKIADLDSDGDGIPDWWLLAYFDHPTGQEADSSLAGGDPDGDGLTNLQEFQAGTNPLYNEFPAAPTNLTATNIFENQIRLIWQDNATNATGFTIQRARTPTGPWTPIPAATDCSVEGGLEYFYQVFATNTVGFSLPSNIASATPPATNNFTAFDRAGNWGNTGVGFGAWTFAGGGANAGFFIGSSGFNGSGGGITIDSCGAAFGLYANTAGSAVATRPFLTPLALGEQFRWRMDNGYIDAGNTVGLILRSGTSARLEFFFQGGSNNYYVADAAGPRDTGVGYSSQALELQFTLTGTNTYALQIARLENNVIANLTGTLTGGNLDSFAIYNRNAGSGSAADAFFNYFIRVAAPDTVGDGIPDAWRLLYFPSGIPTNNQSCATCDPDGDGLNNLAEFRAGTLPRDATSTFTITDIGLSGIDAIISWTTTPGKSYQLFRYDTPAGTNGLPIGAPQPGTGSILTQPDPGSATNSPLQFYRVRLL
ncbi:MAG: alpha-amylase family glycosyl hydrolase [Verrucomicrobiota bacterium]